MYRKSSLFLFAAALGMVLVYQAIKLAKQFHPPTTPQVSLPELPALETASALTSTQRHTIAQELASLIAVLEDVRKKIEE